MDGSGAVVYAAPTRMRTPRGSRQGSGAEGRTCRRTSHLVGKKYQLVSPLNFSNRVNLATKLGTSFEKYFMENHINCYQYPEL